MTKKCSKCNLTVDHNYKTNRNMCKKCLSAYMYKRMKKNRRIIGSYEYYREIRRGSLLSAKRRGIAYSLTALEIKSLYEKTKICYYCGMTQEESSKWFKSRIKYTNRNCFLSSKRLTLDRKNNSKGYVLSNIVLSCSRCNLIRGRIFKFGEFKKIGKVLGTFKK